MTPASSPSPTLPFTLIGTALACAAAVTLALVWNPASVAAAESGQSGLPADAWAWGFGAAALATGLSSLGAGYAVARVGAAAIGALAEKPELFARLLILVGLAEGIAVYGLIISVLVLNRLA